MGKKIKILDRKPWQGKGTKEKQGEELNAPCGCLFRCEPFYWGSRSRVKEKGALAFTQPEPSGWYWNRVKDCEKLRKFILQAYIDGNKRSEKYGEESRRIIRENLKHAKREGS